MAKYATEGTEEYRRADEKRKAREKPDVSREEMLKGFDSLVLLAKYGEKTWRTLKDRTERDQLLDIVAPALRSLIEKHGGEDD